MLADRPQRSGRQEEVGVLASGGQRLHVLQRDAQLGSGLLVQGAFGHDARQQRSELTPRGKVLRADCAPGVGASVGVEVEVVLLREQAVTRLGQCAVGQSDDEGVFQARLREVAVVVPEPLREGRVGHGQTPSPVSSRNGLSLMRSRAVRSSPRTAMTRRRRTCAAFARRGKRHDRLGRPRSSPAPSAPGCASARRQCS